MNSFKNGCKYNRELLSELHSIMEVLRSVFTDDKVISRSIDESYEKVLIEDLKLVPEQFDEEILQYVKAVKIIVANINYRNIYDGLKTLGPKGENVGFETDTYYGAEKILSKFDMSRSDRARIMNVMIKLKPIFVCLDRIFMVPFKMLRKVVEMNDDRYGDIL